MGQHSGLLMKIDFKKIAQEDKEFEKYAKEIIYKITIDLNPAILSMLYGMYSKDLPKDVAYETLKMVIMMGGKNE